MNTNSAVQTGRNGIDVRFVPQFNRGVRIVIRNGVATDFSGRKAHV